MQSQIVDCAMVRKGTRLGATFWWKAGYPPDKDTEIDVVVQGRIKDILSTPINQVLRKKRYWDGYV